MKIGIISLGLIGGSILKALHKKYEFFCYSNSMPEEAFKYCKNISNNLEIVKGCNIVFVCSPISKTLETLEKLNFLDKNTIVADVSSVKKDLLNKNFNFNFILSHPMAGSEKTGFSASHENLFQGAKWLIEKNNHELENIIKELGAIPIMIDMQKHDFLCAQISHVCAIISSLIFDCAEDSAKIIASSGFRDMTRLALSPILNYDMYINNEENIEKAFNQIIEKFENLKKLSNDEKINLFKEIAAKRKDMYDNNGKNIFKI